MNSRINVAPSQEFNRAPRVRPPLPRGEVEIPSPPSMPQPPSTSWWIAVLPVVGILGWIGIGYALSDGGSSQAYLYSAPLMLISVGVSMVTFFSQRRNYRSEKEQKSKAFEEALSETRAKLEESARLQREAYLRIDPPPHELLQRAVELKPELWERRPEDEDFLTLRVGQGRRENSLELRLHKPPAVYEPNQDRRQHEMAQSLGEKFLFVDDVPISVDLEEIGALGVVGPPPIQHSIVRSMVLSLAAQHSPDEVKLVAFTPEVQYEDWAWLRWLPHSKTRVGGNDRWFAVGEQGRQSVGRALQEEIDRRVLLRSDSSGSSPPPLPRFVLLIADPKALRLPVVSRILKEGASVGAYAMVLGSDRSSLPRQCGGVVSVGISSQAEFVRVGEGSPAVQFEPDRVELEECEHFARALAPIRPVREIGANVLPDEIRLLDLMEAGAVEDLQVRQNWTDDRVDILEELSAPVGVRAGGHPAVINLWENIHGPHGLVAGATRSGKTEFLKTLVISLALKYHPHDLVFALIDFKGGGLTRDLEHLPHVVGTATNLQQGLPERALDSIRSELIRREELLQGESITQYQERFQSGEIDTPLPRLVVIVDEFAELASEEPERLESLVSAARVGGALGVHLILATQKPAGVVTGQIWSNSRFRVCLRVETPEDSQDMLRRSDAAALNRPGRAYFQVGDDEVYEQIQVARSQAVYLRGDAIVTEGPKIAEVMPGGQRKLLWPQSIDDHSRMSTANRTTDLQAMIQYASNIASDIDLEELASPWLPPLPESIPLGRVRSLASGERTAGWNGRTWSPADRWLSPVVGMFDDLNQQRQPPLQVDLGGRGHLMVCGSPGSGKTSLLSTLITSLVMDHSPEDLNIQIVEYGGRALGRFASLPHVGTVIHPGEEEVAERLFRWLRDEMEARNDALGSASSLLELKKKGDEPINMPGLLVVIDSLASFIESMGTSSEKLLDDLRRLVREGQRVGIHMVVTADSPAGVPTRVASNMNLRLAFRLTEMADYALALGRTPAHVPASVPGRGLYSDHKTVEVQIATSDKVLDDMGTATDVSHVIEEMSNAWDGPQAHQIRELPKVVQLDDLLEQWEELEAPEEKEGITIPVGLGALYTDIVSLDLADEGPHFLIAGLPQSGKTTVVRTLVEALSTTYSAKAVAFWLVDCLQPGLRELSKSEHVRMYAGPDDEVGRVISALGDEIGSEREDSVRHLLVVDDYELFDNQMSKDEVAKWARRARRLGFHVILSGAVSEMRIGFDDLRNRVLSSRSGFLLSGSHEDAQVFNLRLPISDGHLPPGRGYLIKRGRHQLVQWATTH